MNTAAAVVSTAMRPVPSSPLATVSASGARRKLS
jgi:hypothetical protein